MFRFSFRFACLTKIGIHGIAVFHKVVLENQDKTNEEIVEMLYNELKISRKKLKKLVDGQRPLVDSNPFYEIEDEDLEAYGLTR